MKKSFSSRVVLALVCSEALLAAACGVEPVLDPLATDTGNPYGDTHDGEATVGGCDLVETPLELGAATALGFDAQAIASLVAGEQHHALRWLDAAGLVYGPESGITDVTLRVEPLGTARLVDRSPASGGDGGGGLALAEPLDGCRDSLELDVRIQIETSGGALRESIDTTVEAYNPDFAIAAWSIVLTDLAGTFEATLDVPADAELTRATLSGQVGFSEYGAAGALNVQSELRSAGGAVGQSAGTPLAQFPAEDYCGAPNAVSVLADQAVRGVSLAALLDGLNAQSPASVTYDPASSGELELVFTSSAERVCITFDRDPLYDGEAGGALLRVPGRVQLLSDDGKLDGDFAVELRAQSLGGALSLGADAVRQSQDLASAAQLPGELGIRDDVSLAGYDGAAVRFESHSEAGAAGGSLVVSGLEVPECLSNPAPIDPDAMGAPGCRGIDQTPLWSARWGMP